ncbi:hypothetical protein BC629DRAFT_1595486 [Irpex lacteus]|nr:hypothetical protein BC629DRAFT_1595486 [Irpex lacteus]
MKIFKVPQHLRYSSLEELCDWLDENRELVNRSLWRVNSAAWEKWLDAREADSRLRGTETTYDEYLRWTEEHDEDMRITEPEEEDGPGALPMRAHTGKQARCGISRDFVILTTIHRSLALTAQPIAEVSNLSNEAEFLRQGRTAERISRDVWDDSDHHRHREITKTTVPAASTSSIASPSRQIQQIMNSTSIEVNMGDSNASPLRTMPTHQPSSDPSAIPTSHPLPPLLSDIRPVAHIASQATLSHLDASRAHFLKYVNYTSALEDLVRESFQRHPELMEDEVLRRVVGKVEERAGVLEGDERERGVQTQASSEDVQ